MSYAELMNYVIRAVQLSVRTDSTDADPLASAVTRSKQAYAIELGIDGAGLVDLFASTGQIQQIESGDVSWLRIELMRLVVRALCDVFDFDDVSTGMVVLERELLHDDDVRQTMMNRSQWLIVWGDSHYVAILPRRMISAGPPVIPPFPAAPPIAPHGSQAACEQGDQGADHGVQTTVEALVTAAESMGGRFIGGWRPYRPGEGKSYGARHGVTYYKPHGWVKRRTLVADWDQYRSWPIVYHGTSTANAAQILLMGLRNPSTSGVKFSHGQAGSKSNQSIYTSPSIYLASHPVYAPLFPLGEGKWAQIVLQCKIRPDSYIVRNNTLGYRHWPSDVRLDPNFPDNASFEFLLERPADIVVIGVMYRELGSGIDVALYGELAGQLTDDKSSQGPEYSWTQLLAQHHRNKGFLIEAH